MRNSSLLIFSRIPAEVRSLARTDLILAFVVSEVSSIFGSLSHTFSKELNEDEVNLIKSFIAHGFPKLSGKKPLGYDGHSYCFSIDGDETEYTCWCVIPEEWSHIIPVIDLFADIAGLDEKYRVQGIN